MEKKNLIGKKVRGFEFDDNLCRHSMREYVGEIGVITEIGFDCADIQFDDGANFRYPLDQVHEHLIPEQTEEEKTHAADLKPLGKEKVQGFIDEFESFKEKSHELHMYGSCSIENMNIQEYDHEAIEEAIDLLNDQIKSSEHFTSYPQDFLRGTAPGTNRDIKELISISERHKQKSDRLKTVVEYLEQLK